MPIHSIAHCNFRLEPGLMEEVREFYEQLVGLTVGPRPDFKVFGYWLYAGDADVLHLTVQAPGDERRAGADLTFDHLAFAASDWPSHKARLEKHQVRYAENLIAQTGRRQVFFRDPAGNGVELIFPVNEA
jgi:extradiol dioxygenase family protein